MSPCRCLSAAEKEQRFTTNAAERAACERQLNIIFGAIAKYREQHHNEYPGNLSDLTPEYIADPNVLICPFVKNRGGLRTWKKQFRELSPDSYTSYSYEFAPVHLDEYQWRGLPKKTWREFKERAAQELGPVVPVVRCHDHRPWINLAMSGQIYPSDLYWEQNFTNDDHFLTVSRVFATPDAARPLTAADFPQRDSRADSRLLDLSAHYNASLTNSWQGFPGNNLAALPPGLHEFGGVRFDVRGVIQLCGTEFPALFPRQVEGIPVRQKCRSIHFLHAVSFIYQKGSTNGFYDVHYADGRVQTVTLVYGRQLADWWFDPADRTVPAADAQVAWTGDNEASRAYGKSIRLYRSVWRNPFPDAEIASLGFRSSARKYLAGPFVVAITLE